MSKFEEDLQKELEDPYFRFVYYRTLITIRAGQALRRLIRALAS